MTLVVKNPPVNAGATRDEGSIPGLGRSPGEGDGNPFQYSCLTGYSPWGHKESDMTEQLTLSLYFLSLSLPIALYFFFMMHLPS